MVTGIPPPPPSPPPGSKEVEGWRGQAVWPGKGLKEQRMRGGAVWIDREGRWIDNNQKRKEQREYREGDVNTQRKREKKLNE